MSSGTVAEAVQETLIRQFLGGGDPLKRLAEAEPLEPLQGGQRRPKPVEDLEWWRYDRPLALWRCEWLDAYYDSSERCFFRRDRLTQVLEPVARDALRDLSARLRLELPDDDPVGDARAASKAALENAFSSFVDAATGWSEAELDAEMMGCGETTIVAERPGGEKEEQEEGGEVAPDGGWHEAARKLRPEDSRAVALAASFASDAAKAVSFDAAYAAQALAAAALAETEAVPEREAPDAAAPSDGEEELPDTQLFEVVPGHVISIRNMPILDSPRTGDTLSGLFEVIQVLDADALFDKKQRFLRLADGRGWAFTHAINGDEIAKEAPKGARLEPALALEDFMPGMVVEARSLKTASLNGVQGHVAGFQDDRVQVAFADSVFVKALLPANLRIVAKDLHVERVAQAVPQSVYCAPPEPPRVAEPKVERSNTFDEPWICHRCGFRNRASNEMCGGFGALGCSIPRELEDPIKMCKQLEKDGGWSDVAESLLSGRDPTAGIPQQAETKVAPKVDPSDLLLPWVCRKCSFRNRASNTKCGGFGNLGCSMPRDTQDPAEAAGALVLGAGWQDTPWALPVQTAGAGVRSFHSQGEEWTVDASGNFTYGDAESGRLFFWQDGAGILYEYISANDRRQPVPLSASACEPQPRYVALWATEGPQCVVSRLEDPQQSRIVDSRGVIVGAEPDAGSVGWQISGPHIWPAHARIFVTGGVWSIEPLADAAGSAGKLFVDGINVILGQVASMRAGTVITLGTVDFVLDVPEWSLGRDEAAILSGTDRVRALNDVLRRQLLGHREQAKITSEDDKLGQPAKRRRLQTVEAPAPSAPALSPDDWPELAPAPSPVPAAQATSPSAPGVGATRLPADTGWTEAEVDAEVEGSGWTEAELAAEVEELDDGRPSSLFAVAPHCNAAVDASLLRRPDVCAGLSHVQPEAVTMRYASALLDAKAEVEAATARLTKAAGGAHAVALHASRFDEADATGSGPPGQEDGEAPESDMELEATFIC